MQSRRPIRVGNEDDDYELIAKCDKATITDSFGVTANYDKATNTVER